MKLLKIEFAFQVESKVKSKVKSKKQSKVTVWVGTFKHVKKKQQVSDFLQYLDTRRTKISHYMIQIGFEMLLLSQILLLTLLQLQLQLLLQVSDLLCSCCCSSCCSLVPVVSSLLFGNQLVSNMWYFCLHCIQILKKNHLPTIF